KHRLLALVFIGALTLTHPLAAGLTVVLVLGSAILSLLNAGVLRERGQHTLANFGLLIAVVVIGYWMFLALGLLHSFAPLIGLAQEAPSVQHPFQPGFVLRLLRNAYVFLLAPLSLVAFVVAASGGRKRGLRSSM